ncbi:MAG: hypothetical protein ACWA44_04700 [Thiotrichales bacterium]
MQKTQEQFSVTLLVMSDFSVLPGAPRSCADFCDPTAVFRFYMLTNPAMPVLDKIGKTVHGSCTT